MRRCGHSQADAMAGIMNISRRRRVRIREMATEIDEVALEWLRKALNGDAVLPGDPTYDDARAYSMMSRFQDKLIRLIPLAA